MSEAIDESRFIKSADELFSDVDSVSEDGGNPQPPTPTEGTPPALKSAVSEWLAVKVELVRATDALGQLNRMATGFQTDRIIVEEAELSSLSSVREDAVAEINTVHDKIADLVIRRDEIEAQIMSILPPGVWFAHENLLVGRSRGLTAIGKDDPNFG